jgi:hypothetical protein
MARCEDYPCCGHTDGLPCDWTPPDYRSDPHALCDHENGICEADDDDEDVDCSDLGHYLDEEGRCIECGDSPDPAEDGFNDTPLALDA